MLKRLIPILLAVYVFLPFHVSALSGDETDRHAYTMILKKELDQASIQETILQLEQAVPRSSIEYMKELKIVHLTGLTEAEFITAAKKTGNSYECFQKVAPVQADASVSSFYNPLFMQRFTDYNWYFDVIYESPKNIPSDPRASQIKIGVLDSGLDRNHPIFKQVNWRLAKNYTSDSERDLKDNMGHGTMVAGIIAAVAPSVTIVPYKVMDQGSGESAWVIKAIVDAANDGMDVVNLSLGTYKKMSDAEQAATIEAYERALAYAKSKNTILVASAGNQSSDLDALKEVENTVHLPGGSANVLTVGSTLRGHKVAPYSNSGRELDFVAPGGYFGEDYDETSIIDPSALLIAPYPKYLLQNPIDHSVNLSNGYTLNFGTSLSVPQVSGAAGLIKHRLNSKKAYGNTEQAVIEALKAGALDIGAPGKDPASGFGEINIHRSLSLIK